MTFLSYRTNALDMIRKSTIILVLCLLAISVIRASGQDYIPIFTRDYASRLSIEVDPVAYLMKGYSLHVRYQPMFSDRFLIGLGAYAMDLPEYFLNANATNRDKGWEVRIRNAYLLYGEFYPRRANYGWFIGEQIGFQGFRASNNREVQGSTTFNNVLLMTYIGYSWHPYKGSFYLKPWVGAGFTQKIDGTNRIGSLKYEVGPWIPFAALHIGYTF